MTKYLYLYEFISIMQGDTVVTAGYSGMQAVGMGVVILAIGATLGLYLLGLSGGFLGIAFIGIWSGLMILAWPLFKKAHPRYDSTTQE
jgi:hypothetical protein